MKHLISIRDIKKEDILKILEKSEEMEKLLQTNKAIKRLDGKILGTLFFEPSTRTRLSFETAMKRLGGSVIGFTDIKNTSTMKGESLKDTIRVTSGYVDIIAIRHPKDGASRLASEYSKVPVINAGDGSNQHPTQTLLDLYTIKREIGKIDGIKICFVGDLKYGRTVHSLCYALSMFKNVEFHFIAPDELKLPREVIAELERKDLTYYEYKDMEFKDDLDIIYMTRIQKERFPDLAEYEKVKGIYKLTKKHILNSKAIIMHPLPRVDEIDESVDNLPQSKYFKQSFYGVPVRMAILDMLLNK